MLSFNKQVYFSEQPGNLAWSHFEMLKEIAGIPLKFARKSLSMMIIMEHANWREGDR